MAKKLKFKLGKREVSIWKGWLPIFLILILPEAIISFAPLSEDFSRLIVSMGMGIGETLLCLWMVIVLNPKPMTDLQKRHKTVEQYKKGRRVCQILQVIFLILVVSNTWLNILPSLSNAYRYVLSGTVTYVKGRVSMIGSPNASYYFHESIYIHDDEDHSHNYSINFETDMIHENDCVQFYALTNTEMILSIQKLPDTDACGFEIKTMTDPTWQR